MNRRRKIIAYLATSADGYIARPDGDVRWLDRPRPKNNYGYGEFFRSIDTILWGRKTWEKGVEMGMKPPDLGSKTKSFVFSRRPQAASWPGVEFVNAPVAPFAKRLRARPGKNIWMMGGAGIIGSFLDAGAIDEFSIHVIPILIGDGIPLLARRRRSIRLRLLGTKKFPDGVVHLHYRVTGRRD